MTKTLLILIMLMTSCTHSVHMVYNSDFKARQAGDHYKPIQALAVQKTIMGMVKDTNYVDKAWAKLKKQCREGKIEDVSIQYSTSHGFFSWENKALIQAVCHRG